MKSHAYL